MDVSRRLLRSCGRDVVRSVGWSHATPAPKVEQPFLFSEGESVTDM
jgi:hypothetical protein